MYLYMLSGVAAACRGQFIGNPFPFHDFPSTTHRSITMVNLSPAFWIARSAWKAAFVRQLCPPDVLIIHQLFVFKSLFWPGHGSSRRLPHQQRWSRSHWEANQPSGSGYPSQPEEWNWTMKRVWVTLLVLKYVFLWRPKLFWQLLKGPPEIFGEVGLDPFHQRGGIPRVRSCSPCKQNQLWTWKIISEICILFVESLKSEPV